MAMTIMKSIGIISLLNLSIPSLIPMITINVVTSRKRVWPITGPHDEDTKSENMVLTAS